MSLNKLFVTIFLFISLAGAIAQPVREWVNRYNGEANLFDLPSKMIIDVSDNIYIYGESTGIGSQADFLIVKYTSSGETIWSRRFNGPGNNADRISSAVQDITGNSYVTGFTTGTDGRQYITTAKYDSSGNMLWVRFFEKKKLINGFGQSIALGRDGNIYVSGNVLNDQSNYDVVVLKYNTDGYLIADFVYGGAVTGDCMCTSMLSDSLSGVILCGQTSTSMSGKDIFLMKLDTALAMSWIRFANGSANSDDRASGLALSQNEILLSGSIINSGSYFDYYISKYDPDGNLLWSATYDGAGNNIDIPYSIAADKNGSILVTGYSRHDTVIGSEDILTIKISGSGSTVWKRTYDGPAGGIDQGFTVVTDNSGNVYIGGASDRGNVQVTYFIMKYDSSGNAVWNDTYSVSSTPEDFVYELALDKYNNIYATGISLGTGTSYDIATIKYSQPIGIGAISETVPDFELSQNYPNPFNPVTYIEYKVYKSFHVSMSVYDARGALISQPVNEWKNTGTYMIKFDGSGLPSGIYFYRLKTGKNEKVRKMSLVK